MNAGPFDRLARELAAPMPRRRALWLAAGALVAVVLPGGRAPAASAASAATTRRWVTTDGCGRGGLSCTKQFGPQVSECCGPIDPNDPQSNFTCCPPGECWHHAPAPGGYWTTTCCPAAYRCRGRCCNDGEKCVDGECTQCPSDKLCGKQCCDDSEVCANAKTSLCCVKSWKRCEAGFKGVVRCCPPKESCCFNKAAKTAVCCDAQHPCVNGRCKCTKGETPCGPGKCCKKGEVCSNGKCCPKGKLNCGGRCCDKADCCENTCCDGNSRICVKGKCCPGERLIGAGPSGARCCPKGTVAGSGPNLNTCCPENDPDCCRDGSVKLSCGKGKTCVGGTCKTL